MRINEIHGNLDIKIRKHGSSRYNDDEWRVRVYDGENVIAEAHVVLTETDIRGYQIAQVVNIWVESDYQRQGIATQIYRAIEDEGVLLEPHESQSPEGKAMWKRRKWRDRVDEIRPSEVRDLTKSQYTPIGISRKLEKMGYELKGTGSRSDVYVNPQSNVVVKVSKKDDHCWEGFAEIVRGPGRGNPYFPRVAGKQTVESRHGTYFLAFMEKLNPDVKGLNVKLADWIDRAYGLLESEEYYHIGDFWKGLETGNFPGNPSERVAEQIDKNLIQAIELLWENAPEGCWNDMHEDNFMERDNGQLVIIDPYWDRVDHKW